MQKQTDSTDPKSRRVSSQGSRSLLQYAGLASQLLVSLGLGVFAGLKLDHWLHLKVPVATWLLPLLILVFTLVKIVRDTGTRK